MKCKSFYIQPGIIYYGPIVEKKGMKRSSAALFRSLSTQYFIFF